MSVFFLDLYAGRKSQGTVGRFSMHMDAAMFIRMVEQACMLMLLYYHPTARAYIHPGQVDSAESFSLALGHKPEGVAPAFFIDSGRSMHAVYRAASTLQAYVDFKNENPDMDLVGEEKTEELVYEAGVAAYNWMARHLEGLAAVYKSMMPVNADELTVRLISALEDWPRRYGFAPRELVSHGPVDF